MTDFNPIALLTAEECAEIAARYARNILGILPPNEADIDCASCNLLRAQWTRGWNAAMRWSQENTKP